MIVSLIRVKAGHVATFTDGWRMIVEAHKKATMDEHWAVYQVESGMPDTTFLFLYARKSLAELDSSGPMHAATCYRESALAASAWGQSGLLLGGLRWGTSGSGTAVVPGRREAIEHHVTSAHVDDGAPAGQRPGA